MKAYPAKDIKNELKATSPEDLVQLCLRLARFKKENKELLTYLLFMEGDEEGYVASVKQEVDDHFEQINTKTYYFMKKSLRKSLTAIRKYARYSGKKETEVELLLYFCTKLSDFRPSIFQDERLCKIYATQLDAIGKKLLALHEDLQYDFGTELAELKHCLTK